MDNKRNCVADNAHYPLLDAKTTDKVLIIGGGNSAIEHQEAIKEYLNDNLNDNSKAEDVIKAVDTLEISTIDILKAIVDEVNIHGEISEHSMLNVPKARYKIDIIKFDDLKREDFDDFKQFMKDHVPADESLRSWLDKPWRVNEENKQEDNQDMIEDKFDMNCWITQIASSSPVIIKGQHS